MPNLRAILDALGLSRDPLAAHPVTIAIPDTNIFLHYIPLDQLDLPKLIGVDKIHLIIAPTVLDELDMLKWDHPVTGIRQRAKDSLLRLQSWLGTEQPIKPNVMVSTVGRPTDATFRRAALDSRVKDDHIIATALEQKLAHPSSRVILLTADIGPVLRARHLRLETLQLPEASLLPPARDERKEELLKLQKELNRLQSRLPEMHLTFSDDTRELSLPFPQEVTVGPLAVADQIERTLRPFQKQATPAHRPPPPRDMAKSLQEQYSALFSAFSQIPPEEHTRFKNEMARFPEAYREYMREYVARQNSARRAMSIELRLQNSGTAIAEDIILTAKLPEKMKWLASLDGFNPPDQPPIPTPPRPGLHLSASLLQHAMSRPQLSRSPHPAATNPRIIGPFVQGNIATWEFPTLHHKSYWPLGPIWAYFPDAATVSPFDIAYSIRERNTPNIVGGNLLVRVL